ncbi:MAG: hypothetical protein IT472_08795 [Thermomonas sp.]|uniref:hypothetical protein n=1 Tax=Thermomonas sp. TaxID=1971895 RepID=UPI00260FE453|nr:hypothetical protein [Thermomonas sp.]MCC7097262.1 hypothetical protein [Thermomonas sp.]
MSNILILQPTAIAAIAVSRGTGGANLLTPDPKEVWTDSAVGSAATIDIDLGSVQTIDTIALISVIPPVAGTTWSITGGSASYTTSVIRASTALRAVDATGQAQLRSHALHFGATWNVRYIRVTVTQPAGLAVLSIGVSIIGKAFVPVFNNEWGAGRRVIDTGTSTALAGGGFANVEGVRKGSYAFTLGDLSNDEVDALYAIQLAVGETSPLLIVEDPAVTAGQYHRIHYGQLRSLRAFDRRSPGRTRWELTIDQWV